MSLINAWSRDGCSKSVIPVAAHHVWDRYDQMQGLVRIVAFYTEKKEENILLSSMTCGLVEEPILFSLEASQYSFNTNTQETEPIFQFIAIPAYYILGNILIHLPFRPVIC